jgi:hypothetical protein
MRYKWSLGVHVVVVLVARAVALQSVCVLSISSR